MNAFVAVTDYDWYRELKSIEFLPLSDLPASLRSA